MSRLVMEDALLAEAYRLYVAAAIEDGESVAIKQNPGAVVGKRGRCANVELVADFNDVLMMFFLNRWKHHRRTPQKENEKQTTSESPRMLRAARFFSEKTRS